MSDQELTLLNAYWRECNYLAARMIYLQDNPLLNTPLTDNHIKNRLLGH
jgi:xylulose-5-phosphate/fructose-6-phosphate phosphoketolase